MIKPIRVLAGTLTDSQCGDDSAPPNPRPTCIRFRRSFRSNESKAQASILQVPARGGTPYAPETGALGKPSIVEERAEDSRQEDAQSRAARYGYRESAGGTNIETTDVPCPSRLPTRSEHTTTRRLPIRDQERTRLCCIPLRLFTTAMHSAPQGQCNKRTQAGRREGKTCPHAGEDISRNRPKRRKAEG